MAYLASLLYGYRVIDTEGSPVAQRATLNFKAGTGATLTVVDNPGLQTTDVTIASSSGSGITQLTADVVAIGPGVASAEVQAIRGRTVAGTLPSTGALLVYDAPTSTWNPRAASQDVTLDATGAFTVVGLQTYPISTTAPTSGQVLSWTGAFYLPAYASGGITELTGDVTAGPGSGSQVAAIAAGVIVDNDVNASAAIAGTKIAPDFGAQNVLLTGYIGLATTRAASGTVRAGTSFSLVALDPGGTTDRNILNWDGSANLILGGSAGIGSMQMTANGFQIYSTSGDAYIDCATVNFRGGSHTSGAMIISATNVAVGQPQIGNGTAWGSVNATATQAMGDANQTLVAAKYQCTRINTTGGITADRDLVFPTATDDQGYLKIINNQCTSGGPYGIVVKAGAAPATVTVALNMTAIVWIDSAGVTRITADA